MKHLPTQTIIPLSDNTQLFYKVILEEGNFENDFVNFFQIIIIVKTRIKGKRKKEKREKIAKHQQSYESSFTAPCGV